MPYKDQAKRREYQRRWKDKRRTQWLIENGPCKVCGTWKNLEVDHIDPSKKSMDPTDIWCRKKEDRDKELAKCQVLCNHHHGKKTCSTEIDLESGFMSWKEVFAHEAAMEKLPRYDGKEDPPEQQALFSPLIGKY